MKTIETKRMEMCIRVIENRQEFPLIEAEGLDGTKIYDELEQFVGQMRSSEYDQSRAQSSLREISARVDKKRKKLLKKLDGIRRTVRSTGLPGLENKFLPARDVNDRGLIALAATYGNDVFSIKAALNKLGLKTDFINDLSQAAQEFDEALNDREKGLSPQMTATSEIEQKVEDAMNRVRNLDVIIGNVYADDPVKLALWERISHVERISRRSRQEEEDDDNPAPPAQS